MKWIMILIIIINNCQITDEATYCERKKNNREGVLTCESSFLYREMFFEFDEDKGLNPRTDPNSAGNQFTNNIIVSCLLEYVENENCRKKSHIKPVLIINKDY
ncbi:MAG: hypothetical protein KDK36_20885 [Leptospiraceae bacterium]|nr:hypothetical protein [Leptospiraceae bacterium]